MAGQKSNIHQRELGYRAVIPFYILWDTDLNGNDLRFYGQIEQMESNPSPNVDASFSYQWIASMLGINRRNAINIANKLKKKGYITRTKINQKEYLWNTVKKGVLVSSGDTSLVSPSDTSLVSPSDTQNTNKLNTSNEIKDINESVDSTSLVSPEGLALVYTEELPLLSHPRDLKKLNKELLKTLNALIKRWPIDISDKGNKLTYEVFRGIIRKLKEIDYWMFKPEKDAGMIVFCRISNMQTAIEKLIAHEKQGRK
jgi:DNA-binding Lrp family transcriptional regulator